MPTDEPTAEELELYELGYKNACQDIIYAICKGCNKDFIDMRCIFNHVIANLRNDPEYKPKEVTKNAR